MIALKSLPELRNRLRGSGFQALRPPKNVSCRVELRSFDRLAGGTEQPGGRRIDSPASLRNGAKTTLKFKAEIG